MPDPMDHERATAREIACKGVSPEWCYLGTKVRDHTLDCDLLAEPIATALAAARVTGERVGIAKAMAVACLWCREGVRHDPENCAGREIKALLPGGPDA